MVEGTKSHSCPGIRSEDQRELGRETLWVSRGAAVAAFDYYIAPIFVQQQHSEPEKLEGW